jgi:hypothetical protein
MAYVALARPAAVDPNPPRTADAPLRAMGADDNGDAMYVPPEGTWPPIAGASQ